MDTIAMLAELSESWDIEISCGSLEITSRRNGGKIRYSFARWTFDGAIRAAWAGTPP